MNYTQKNKLLKLCFRNSYEELGIKESPLKKNENIIVTTEDEVTILFENANIFTQMLNFFKESCECLFILLRHSRTKLLYKDLTSKISNLINETRFKIGSFFEEFMVYEKIACRELKNNLTIESKRKSFVSEEKEKQEKLKKLLVLLKNKFRFHSVHFTTRESKINLNNL